MCRLAKIESIIIIIIIMVVRSYLFSGTPGLSERDKAWETNENCHEDADHGENVARAQPTSPAVVTEKQ